MNIDQATQWKNDVLDEVFAALAASNTLTARFIYKGARVLNRRLGTNDRQSLDIDINLTTAFQAEYPDRKEQAAALQAEILLALTRYFGEQDIVRYEVNNVRVSLKPKADHPHGWNAFGVRIGITDRSRPGVTTFPALELDIAAPETLGAQAVAPLEVDGHEVIAYTLERIAGEKLRAFLSSLSAYRTKLQRPGDAVRAKDIYDIARIERVRPIGANEWTSFWTTAGGEFRLACQSRYIDCAGIETFTEHFDVTRATYDTDAALPKDDIPFDRAWKALERIVEYLIQHGVVPFAFPLPKADDSL